MDSDGSTLYFSAKGEESMGGYDIFITRTDSEDNTFLKPDNLGLPFNSPANDYMFVLDDYSNLGWFASDRYQPEDSVCVYVFVPNEQKVVYDYDNTDPAQLQSLAALNSIVLTQGDVEKVTNGRQHLSDLREDKKEQTNKSDFKFVIDDDLIYHTLKDFTSKDAKKQYQVLVQVENDKRQLNKELSILRRKYSSTDKSQKDALQPEILDKERRVQQLEEELASLETEVRNLELSAKGKK